MLHLRNYWYTYPFSDGEAFPQLYRFTLSFPLFVWIVIICTVGLTIEVWALYTKLQKLQHIVLVKLLRGFLLWSLWQIWSYTFHINHVMLHHKDLPLMKKRANGRHVITWSGNKIRIYINSLFELPAKVLYETYLLE